MKNHWIAISATIVALWIAICASAVLGVARCYRLSAVFVAGKREEMKREFATIPVLPGATAVSTSDSWKPGLNRKDGQALVGANYSSRAPYSEIRAHYDSALRERGWRGICEESVKDWGKDLGGRSREYRKGDLRAALQFAGDRAEYGWTYAFDLTWGLRAGCR